MDKYRTYQILLIEDDEDDAFLIEEILSTITGHSFKLAHVTSASAGVEKLLHSHFDIILLDLNLPDSTGIDTVKKINLHAFDIPVIVLTGFNDQDIGLSALNAGAQDFLVKGEIKGEELFRSIQYAISRKQIEENIRHSQSLLVSIFNNTPNILILLDENLQVMRMNQTAQKAVNMTERNAIGRKGGDVFNCLNHLISPGGCGTNEACKGCTFRTTVNKTFEENQEFSNIETEFLVVQDDQPQLKKFILSTSNIQTTGGKMVLVGLNDVTELQNAKENALLSEKRYRDLIRNLGAGVVIHAADTSILNNNQKASELLGLSDDQLKGKKSIDPAWNFKDINHKILPVHEYPANKIFQTKEKLSDYVLGVYRPKQQDTVWLIANGYPVFDKNGDIVEIVISFIDFTKRKNAEDGFIKAKEHAESNEAKLLAALESMTDAIFITDLKGAIINVNQSFMKLLGFKTEQDFLDQPEDYPLNYNVYWQNGELAPADMWATPRALRGETVVNEIYIIERKDTGNRFIASYSFAPIRNTQSEIEGCVVTFRDVTESINKEKELIAAKEKAEQSERLKSAFLANMSHEIRTPMNSIIGFLDLLEDPEIPEEEKGEFFNIIRSSGDRLLATINDIIDISKIEAGEIKMYPAQVNITEMIRYFKGLFRTEIERKGLQLEVSCPEKNDEIIIFTDKVKLEAILGNFIKNAIKFTNHGTIEFGYELNQKAIKFFVRDTGVGIPQEKIQLIFNRFIQVDSSITRQFEGSGLGLAIASAYADMLEGKIDVQSTVDKGSEFSLQMALNGVSETKPT